jgi:hypothetical protein
MKLEKLDTYDDFFFSHSLSAFHFFYCLSSAVIAGASISGAGGYP